MAWTDLTFVECSLLTAAKMTQLQDNFAALAGGAPGAPRPAIDDVASLATVHAASGFAGPQVSSLAQLHVGSGIAAPQVSSFGALHAGSGLAAPGVSSLGRVQADSGYASAAVSSLHRVVTRHAFAEASSYGSDANVDITHFRGTETVIATVSGDLLGNRVELKAVATLRSGNTGQNGVLRWRVGSAGGAEVGRSYFTAGLGGVTPWPVLGYDAPGAGGRSYVLTGINATANNSVGVTGWQVALIEQPVA